jgi:hypothetical protein
MSRSGHPSGPHGSGPIDARATHRAARASRHPLAGNRRPVTQHAEEAA